MLPQGFFGTEADVLMDIVVLAFAVIVPTLIFSWIRVRRGQWQLHKRIQLSLASVLAVAVVLFEIDMRVSGGIFEMTQASSWAGTGFYNGSVYFHTVVAISTSLLWIGLVLSALIKFDKSPVPNAFSNKHKLFGRLGMIFMLTTGITGIQIYVFGFVL
jgi:putative membrane protein